jgi:hypothetical protein
MRKFIFSLILTIGMIGISMAQHCADTAKSNCCIKPFKVDKYISYGLSLSNSNDFKTSTFTSLEAGVMFNNISIGGVFGRALLKDMFTDKDDFSNYFYELKTTVSQNVNKNVTVFGLFGYGGYFNSNRMFIEYGAGAAYSVRRFTYGVQASNWDSNWYITPMVMFNF